jgi:hypothetical protein
VGFGISDIVQEIKNERKKELGTDIRTIRKAQNILSQNLQLRHGSLKLGHHRGLTVLLHCHYDEKNLNEGRNSLLIISCHKQAVLGSCEIAKSLWRRISPAMGAATWPEVGPALSWIVISIYDNRSVKERRREIGGRYIPGE